MNPDLAWLVGLMEGEGSFCTSQRGRYTLFTIAVAMTDHDVIKRAASLLGTTVRAYDAKSTRQPLYQASIHGREHVRAYAHLLQPHMGTRRQQQITRILDALDTYPAYTRGRRAAPLSAELTDLIDHLST